MSGKRRSPHDSPTELSMKLMRKRGWHIDIAERRTGRVTKDLFGFADLVAFKPGMTELAFIQTTSRHHVSERVAKVRQSDIARELHEAGHVIVVHGWDLDTDNRIRVKEILPW